MRLFPLSTFSIQMIRVAFPHTDGGLFRVSADMRKNRFIKMTSVSEKIIIFDAVKKLC